MVLVLALGVVLVVVLVRELARWLVQRGPFQIRAMFDLVAPGSLRRRVATIAAGFVAMYLAIVGLALGGVLTYGLLTSRGFYGVEEVIEGGASVGKLRAGDRIEAIDGEPIQIGIPPTLLERINAKGGAPVDVHIRRDGAVQVIRIEPRQSNASGRPQWLIGIRPTHDMERSSAGGLGFAFAYPWNHAKGIGRQIARAFEGRDDVVNVERIVEEIEAREPKGMHVLITALRWSGHLLLLALLVDLIRLVLVIRDRLRG